MAGLNQRVGIFGGSFDPPHLGHLILAAEAVDTLKLDQLFWVLTPDPPHKRDQVLSPIAMRLELLQSAIQNNPDFQLSDVDLNRPGPHFTLDTVIIMREAFPNATIYYLIGGDSLHDFPNWHAPAELLTHLNGLGVMRRPGDAVDLKSLELRLPGISDKVVFIDAPLLEIASSEIRRRIQQGKAYRYYLPDAVYRLIQSREYYRL